MKKKFEKFATAGSKENRKDGYIDSDQIIINGNAFGNIIINGLICIVTDKEGIAVAAVGLAKAVAALKDVARHSQADIDTLFPTLLREFEKEIQELPG